MDYSEAQWRNYHHLHFIALQNALKGLEQVAANQITANIMTPEWITKENASQKVTDEVKQNVQ